MTLYRQRPLFKSKPRKPKAKPLVHPDPPRETLKSFLSPAVWALIETPKAIVRAKRA